MDSIGEFGAPLYSKVTCIVKQGKFTFTSTKVNVMLARPELRIECVVDDAFESSYLPVFKTVFLCF